ALYLTGHSLGGALAALLGIMVATEPEYRAFAQQLRAIYSYGQPMVGDPALARACEDHPFLGRNVVRYVYGNDVVTRLSPKPSGPFAHFGREYRCRAGVEPRRWVRSPTYRTQISNLLELASSPLSILTKQVPWLRKLNLGASFHDHLPHHYVAALTPPGVRTEFGD
ncbi:MAG: lipase family protein, partial [Acidimicrobiales bacterium]